MKSPGAPMETLLPRIAQLSKPRFVTPKYQKPCEEPIILPGKICDWAAHRQWLAERAKPKKDFNKRCEQANEAVCSSSPRISGEGMRRIQCLAKPRKKSTHWTLRPRSTNFHRSATASFCKLSEPKVRFDLQLDCRPILKVSKSTMSYQREFKKFKKKTLLKQINIFQLLEESNHSVHLNTIIRREEVSRASSASRVSNCVASPKNVYVVINLKAATMFVSKILKIETVKLHKNIKILSQHKKH
jgi:hypothetical protein